MSSSNDTEEEEGDGGGSAEFGFHTSIHHPSSRTPWATTQTFSELGTYEVYLPSESYPVGVYLIFISKHGLIEQALQ